MDDNRIAEIASRMDSFVNLVTGMGTDKDRSSYVSIVERNNLDDRKLSILHTCDDIARKIVDKIPKEMMRKGYELSTEEDTEAVVHKANALDFDAKVTEAQILARLFGGSIIIVGYNGTKEDPKQPLGTISSIDYLNVFDRRHVTPSAYYDDPLSPNFGNPSMYRLHSRGKEAYIHESRTFRFEGLYVEPDKREQLNGWGLSVLQPVYEVLAQFAQSWKGTTLLLTDASQGIFKLKNLIDMISDGHEDKLQKRMALVDLQRSNARSLLVDAESEDFQKVSTSFQGISDILDMLMMRVSSAAEMPMTLLFGRSPAGMNATGESDIRLFYDNVASMQVHNLEPVINDFYSGLFAEYGKPEAKFEVKFLPLWEQTSKEDADEKKIRSETDEKYFDMGVLSPSEIRTSRYGGEEYGREIQISEDTSGEMEKAETETIETAIETGVTVGQSEGPSFELTASTRELYVSVNEARAKDGLPAEPNKTIGNMKLIQYKAMLAAEVATAAQAEQGEADVDGKDPV